jgi:pimeloyl-ACP methyl ester carboxylesterase
LFEKGELMSSTANPTPALRHRAVDADGIRIHVVEAGRATNPAVLFLHGWPESWAAFEDLLPLMADTTHAIAIDLPGIGESPTPPPANDKRTIARCVHGVIGALGLRNVTLVGHDVGGMVAYVSARISWRAEGCGAHEHCGARRGSLEHREE